MKAFEIILLLAFFGGLAALFMVNLKRWNKLQKTKDDGFIKYSAIYYGKLKHIEGLPITSGVLIDFFYGNKKLTFKKDEQEIFLDCDKIISMDVVLGKDVKSNAATGAVAGKYLLGGISGAAIGAMLATTFYFVILYKKDSENKTIILDSTGSDLPFKKIFNDFKSTHHTETQKIEL